MRDLSGSELGRYRLTRLVGRGGMASVYEALDPILQRPVAVKVLGEQLAEEPDFVGRFRHEAQAVAALRHPSIVRVYDFGDQDDCYYMVMEFVDGPSLVDLLADVAVRGETLAPDAVVRLITPVCSALDYGHQRGMVHRDIKPANILLTADLQPVLSDYGIAKIAGMTAYTGVGMVMGTAAYMAPEQAQGLPTDGRCDIYSLAIVAFEALVGRVPFRGETTGEVLAQHTVAPIPSARSLNPRLADGVDVALERALAKEAAARYATAGEFAEALRRGLEVRPADATGPVLPPETARTVLTGSGPAARALARKAPAPAEDVAAPRSQPARVTAPTAEEVAASGPDVQTSEHQVSAPVATAAEPVAGSPTPLPGPSASDQIAAASIAAAPPSATPPASRLSRAKDAVSRFIGTGRRRTWIVTGAAAAVVLAGLIAAVATTTSGGGPKPSPSAGADQMVQGQQLMQMAQAALSAGMIQQAVSHAQKAVDLDPSPMNFQTLGLALDALPSGEGGALDAFQSSIDAGATSAHSYALLAHSRFDTAWAAQSGDYQAATEAAEEALARDEDEPLAHAVLAKISAAAAAKEQALAEVKLALQSGTRDDVTLMDIAWVYSMLDDWENVVKYRRLAVDLTPNRADYRNSLANAYRMTGELDKARQEAEAALTLDSSWASSAHATLGLIYQDEKDYAAAEEQFRAALEADPHNDYALWALGRNFYNQALYREALPYFTRAVAEKRDGGNLTWLGACYLRLKRYEEAREALEEAIRLDPTRDDAQRLLDELPSE